MPEKETVWWILLTAGGYLLGSVHFCRWIPWLLHRKDLCRISADGNPGAANVFVHFGWKLGLTCLFLDMAKGFLPTFLALRWLSPADWWFCAVMTAPVLGHAASVFDRMRGGKCIAAVFGVLSALLWISPVGLILAGLYVLFSTLLKISPNRRRSQITFALFLPAGVITEIALGQFPAAAGCGLIAGIALIKHLLPERNDKSFSQIREE